MSKLKAFLFSMVMVLMTSGAFAGGGWTNVTVSLIEPCTSGYTGCGPNGFVWAELSANSTGTPACVTTNNKNWVVVDTTTAAGAFAAAVMQSARLSGTTINLGGTGSCMGTTGTEILGYVRE